MRDQVIKTAALLVGTIVFGSLGYYIVLGFKASFLDCVYMTIVTVSTVGYGEMIEVKTPAAKIYTMGLMLFGIGALGYAISLMTAFLVEGQLTDMLRRRRVEKTIAKLKGHTIVCGGGQTAYHVIEELDLVQTDIVVVEADASNLEPYKRWPDLLTVIGDASDDEVLERAGIARARGLVLTLPSDKDNLFVTVSARQLNPSLRIVAKGVGPKMRNKLLRAGANAVVSPNTIGGLRLASELVRPSVVSFLDAMLRKSDQTLRIEEIPVKADSKLADKTIASCELRSGFNLLILALMDRSMNIDFNPGPNATIEAGKTIVVMGAVEDVIEARKLGQA